MKNRKNSGFTLVELLVVIAIIGVLVSLLLPAVQMARASARRMQSSNHLRQLALGVANFESTYKYLPNGGGYDYTPGMAGNSAPYQTTVRGVIVPTPNAYSGIPNSGNFRPRWGDPAKPAEFQLGSTFFAILPYVEQSALFDDPIACFSKPVSIYYNPNRRRAAAYSVPTTDAIYPGWTYNDGGAGASARTDYAANDQLFFTTYAGWGKVGTLATMQDGTSNTIMFGEKAMAAKAVQAGVWYWDEPYVMGGTGGTGRCGDELYSDMQLNNFPERASGAGWSVNGESCGGGNWGSPGPGGPQFAFGDGSVRLINYNTPPTTVRLLIRPGDGIPVPE